MNKLLLSLIVLTLYISTIQALACYEHHQTCAHGPTCLIDQNRKNCTGTGKQYCFKDDMFLGVALRGCGDASYCNVTILLGTRYCCDIDYCNHAAYGMEITRFMILTMLIVIYVMIK